MSRFVLVAAAALAVGGAVACGPRLLVSAGPPALTTTAARPPRTGAVIVISIDGLRPDAIREFGASTLLRLMAEGGYSLEARTAGSGRTLPSHTSMLTGLPQDGHGVDWNDPISHRSARLPTASVFGVARAHGFTTAAFFGKAKFSYLQQPEALDYSIAPRMWLSAWPATKTVPRVEAYLGDHAPQMLFVHLSDPDSAGHRSRWMSPAYGRAVRAADEGVRDLLVAADLAYGAGGYTVIVTADHGGHGTGHGCGHPLDVTIPWIVWGHGVTRGPIVGREIQTIDTAATVLFLLGIDRPADWMGAPVAIAFAAVS